jgi:hypothetical protein
MGNDIRHDMEKWQIYAMPLKKFYSIGPKLRSVERMSPVLLSLARYSTRHLESSSVVVNVQKLYFFVADV